MERVPKQKVISKNSPKREKNEKKHCTFNIKRCLETLVLRFGWFFKKKGVFRASTSVRLVGNSYCDIFGFFISTGRFQYQYRKVKNHLKKHATVRTKPLCPGFLAKKSTKALDRAIPSVQGASCTKSSTRKIHFFNTYFEIVFLPWGTPPSQTHPPTKPQPKLRNYSTGTRSLQLYSTVSTVL